MPNSISLFEAIQGKVVVGSDSSLDMIVVWNESSTFNVYYQWSPDRYECIKTITEYDITSITEAKAVANDFFDNIYEEESEDVG